MRGIAPTTASRAVAQLSAPRLRRRGAAVAASRRAGATRAGDALTGSRLAGELAAALEAVRRAARLCTAAQSSLQQSTETLQKADDSPVTVADFAAQAIVSWSLRERLPDVALVAEEDAATLRTPGGAELTRRVTALVNAALAADGVPPLAESAVLDAIDRGASQGGARGRFWVLDPIDGTKGFVRGAQYAVALGLLEDGKVTMGVLGCPNLPLAGLPPAENAISVARGPTGGSLMFAARGCGAWQVALGAPGWEDAQRVSVDASRAAASARYMESERHSIAAAYGRTARVAELMRTAEPPIRMDSQAKYALMARGDADLYLRFPPADYSEKIWDHAAGSIIVEEAGGVMQDAAGEPLDFGTGRTLRIAGGIVGCPPQMRDSLLGACRDTQTQ